MNQPVQQHQLEIQRNQQAWANKPLLRDIYRDFYQRIVRLVDDRLQGRILELGSGIGALRAHLPDALLSDLFPNAWLDLVADGYALPFGDQSLSHLILFDVFHHLRAPKAFLHEARRVLVAQGRIILVEPYISWTSLPVYSLLHHEPVAWREKIEMAESPPARDYYAAQGNATRLFFRREQTGFLEGWSIFHSEALASCSYLLSGGFSKPSFYPRACLPALRRIDRVLSRWPNLFGARCLIGLRRTDSH